MEDKDLRIYAFENALNILQTNLITTFDKKQIDELFDLSDRIYNYLNITKND